MAEYDDSPFRRTFYTPPDVSTEEAERVRERLGITVEKDNREKCPPPIETFEDLDLLPDYVFWSFTEQGITKPMPIQAQALPLALSGHDVIGLAQTGSGKTLAFLLPAVVHMEARKLATSREPAPLVLVLAPTRELAVQISDEAEKILWHSKYGKHSQGLRSVCLYGGGNKHEQKQKLSQGGQVVVATPGRLLDFVNSGFISLASVTFFVLDEADRMLDMGFLGDVNAISRCIRPDRQVLFFSATWNDEVQAMARTLCDPHGQGPVRISSGQASKTENGLAAKHQAREGIEQRVVVVDTSSGDWKKQAAQKRSFMERYITSVLESSEDHKILVFVSQKQVADELSDALYKDGFTANSMHGGKSQENRLWILDQFRQGKLRLLVCTDVIGRGIDLPNVSHVVIYEMGSIDDYIHRIGRTGRGPHGKGQALVLFEYWDKQPEIASELVEVLNASQQPVPEELRRIALEVENGKRGYWNQSKQNQWDSWGGANGWNSNTGGYTGKQSNEKKPEVDKASTSKVEEIASRAKKVEPPEEVPDAWDDE